MPTLSVFIRVEDVPKWKALANKSQWLHDHLNAQAAATVPVKQKPMVDTPKQIPEPPGELCSRHHVPLSVCAHKH